VASQRVAVEDAAFTRLFALTEPVDCCLDPCVVYTSANDHLVRILVQTYRALTSATVLVTAPRGICLLMPDIAWGNGGGSLHMHPRFAIDMIVCVRLCVCVCVRERERERERESEREREREKDYIHCRHLELIKQ
jgi:hypothetical protein